MKNVILILLILSLLTGLLVACDGESGAGESTVPNIETEPTPTPEPTPTTETTITPRPKPPPNRAPTPEPMPIPEPTPTPKPTPTPGLKPHGPYIPIVPDTSLLGKTPLPVLEAYYEVLRAAVDEFGFGDDAGFGGVVFADFVDLDNDGIPELILIHGNHDEIDYEDYWRVEVKIYGYTEGLILHTSYFLYPTHTNEVRKATCRYGLSYLTYSEVGGLCGFDKYYSVVNGEWTLALSLTWGEKSADDLLVYPGFDDDYGMDVWNDFCVNGNSVNWESYRNAPETELGIVSERTLWNWWGHMGWDYVYKGADDWHIDISEYWSTVPTVLAALESLIGAA